MQIYHGVVEDFNDPLKLGRVKVRVFGLHTDDTSLIPTESLPWATVMQSAGTSSISTILPGSWVILFFQDPDNQYPIVLGIIYGIPTDNTGQVAADEEQRFEYSDNAAVTQNVLKDSSGTPVVNSDGVPIKTTPTEAPAVSPSNGRVDPNKLGTVSEKYESSGNPSTVNTRNYKAGIESGGAQYGAWQLASYRVSATEAAPGRKFSDGINSPVWSFIRFARLTQFNGLLPATDEFDTAWKTWSNANKAESYAIQHRYIMQTYYQATIARLPQSISSRGVAVHEMVWSMAVQLGQSGAVSKITSIVSNYDNTVCDSKIIADVYNARISTVQRDFKSSPGQWSGLIKRFNSERDDLIRMCKTYEGTECSGAVVLTTKEQEKVVYDGTTKKVVKETVVTREPSTAQSTTKGPRGFRDMRGITSSSTEPVEPDTNRLARGVITGTFVEKKRREVIQNREAGEVNISEPTTQYNALYPYNTIYATKSGHIVEFDDTPGYERISIQHRTGTFVEIHPDGKMVTKIIGTNTLVVTDDNNRIVVGSENVSIDGSKNETVKGSSRLVVYGDVVSTVYGNVDINVTGNTKIKSARIDLNPE